MSLGALVALSARAHLFPSNRAGCSASLPHPVGHDQFLKESRYLFGPRWFLCTICSAALPFLHLILSRQSSHRYQAVRLSDSLGRNTPLRDKDSRRSAASQSTSESALCSPHAHRPCNFPELGTFLQLSLKQSQHRYLLVVGEGSSTIHTASRADKRTFPFNCSNNKTREAQRATASTRHKSHTAWLDTWCSQLEQLESNVSPALVTVNRPLIACRLVKSSCCVDSTDLSPRSKLPHLPASTDPAFLPHKLSGL
jgi:hypothetical protein